MKTPEFVSSFRTRERVQHLLDLNRYPEAISELGRLLASDPDDPHTLFQMAFARLHNGDMEEAEKAARQSIAADPEHPGGYGILSHIAEKHYFFDDALELAETAARLNPDSEFALYRLAQCLSQCGQPKKAFATGKELVRLSPESELAHLTAGDAALELSKWADAQAHYKAALRLDPNNDSALHNLALVYRKRRKYGEATTLLFDAVRTDPSNRHLQDTLYDLIDTWIGRRAWLARGDTVQKEIDPAVWSFYQSRRKAAKWWERVTTPMLVLATLACLGLGMLIMQWVFW